MGLDMYLFKRKNGKINEEMEEILYWRKANCIHNWFNNHIPGVCNRCECIVTKENLINLLNDCKEVLNNSVIIEGTIITSIDWDAIRGWHEELEPGKIIKDTSIAEKILPTCNGFFFGSTDYDQYYIDHIKYTITKLEKILQKTNFEEYDIIYSADW